MACWTCLQLFDKVLCSTLSSSSVKVTVARWGVWAMLNFFVKVLWQVIFKCMVTFIYLTIFFEYTDNSSQHTKIIELFGSYAIFSKKKKKFCPTCLQLFDKVLSCLLCLYPALCVCNFCCHVRCGSCWFLNGRIQCASKTVFSLLTLCNDLLFFCYDLFCFFFHFSYLFYSLDYIDKVSVIESIELVMVHRAFCLERCDLIYACAWKHLRWLSYPNQCSLLCVLAVVW